MNRYLDFIESQHKLIVFFALIVTACFGFGLSSITVTNDFRVYFSGDNPQLKAFNDMKDRFGTDDGLFIYIEPNNQQVFTASTLRLVEDLTREAWTIPHSIRVSSIQNHRYIYATDDHVFSGPLYEMEGLPNETQLIDIKNKATQDPSLRNSLVNADGRATGIHVGLAFPIGDIESGVEAVLFTRELLNKYRQEYPDVTLKLAGNTYGNVVFGEVVNTEVTKLTLGTFLVVIVLLIVLLRSVVWMMLTLLLIIFSVVSAIGLHGWMGGMWTPVSAFVPNVVMTIAIADTVHILYSYFVQLRQGQEKSQAIREALKINVNPVFVTSLTTIIGMLCLNFSDSPPYQDLGTMIAFGALVAWGLSMTLLPACLFWLPAKRIPASTGITARMEQLSEFVVQQRVLLAIVVGAVGLVLALGSTRNFVDDRPYEYFDQTTEVRQTYDAIDENLTGIQSISYLMDSGKEGGLTDPIYLQELDAFVGWLESQEGVIHVASLSTTIKRLNQVMNGDDRAFYRIPDDANLAAQYLLVYEMTLPTGLGLDNVMSLDRSATQVAITLGKIDSSVMIDLDQRAQRWLKENTTRILPTEATGLSMVFAHITQRNMESLLKGTVLALVLISLVLIFSLRSLKYGLISLIPNLLPAAVGYGIWGYLVGQVDLALAVVICMSLGIVVDDTVHFLSKYIRGVRELNYSTEDGVRYSFQTIGGALLITTIVLVLGFSVLGVSSLTPISRTGTLLALIIAVALILDFLLLPPLLMAIDRDKNKSDQNDRYLEDGDSDLNSSLHQEQRQSKSIA